jgi:type II secretory pathway pseudopilin PulG
MSKKKSKKRKKPKGFTLIEITVICIIFVILVSLVVVSMRSSNAKGRDAKRVSELNNIRTALQMYYMDHGRYPSSTDSENWCSLEQSDTESNNFCRYLIDELIPFYLPEIPQDPIYGKGLGSSEKFYSYQYVSTSSGDGYKLHTDLETRDPYELFSYVGRGIAYARSDTTTGNGGSSCTYCFFETIKGESGFSGKVGQGNSALKVSTGGYLITGNSYYFTKSLWADMFLTKIYSNGDLASTESFGQSFTALANRGIFSIMEYGTGYLLAGVTTAPGNDYEFWFAELGSDLSVTRSRILDGTGQGGSGDQRIIAFEENDNGYLFSGISPTFSGPVSLDLIAVQANSALDSVSWAYTMDPCGDSGSELFGFSQETEGGFITAGYNSDCGLVVTKVDPADGTIKWSYNLDPSSSYARVHNILRTSSGDHLILGYAGMSDELFLAKFDSDGNFDWIKGLGGGYFSVYNQYGTNLIRELSDGYILVANTDFGQSGENILLMKVNLEVDDIEWAKALGEDGDDRVNFIQETSNGDFIVTGYQDYDSPDEEEVIFALLNSEGHIDDCSCLSDQTSNFSIDDLTSSFDIVDWTNTTTISDVSSGFDGFKNKNANGDDYTASTTIRDICPE